MKVALGDIPLIDVSSGVGLECPFLRSGLRRKEWRIKPCALDLLIVATAIAHGLTLVTRNVDDYRDVTGLQLFDS